MPGFGLSSSRISSLTLEQRHQVEPCRAQSTALSNCHIDIAGTSVAIRNFDGTRRMTSALRDLPGSCCPTGFGILEAFVDTGIEGKYLCVWEPAVHCSKLRSLNHSWRIGPVPSPTYLLQYPVPCDDM